MPKDCQGDSAPLMEIILAFIILCVPYLPPGGARGRRGAAVSLRAGLGEHGSRNTARTAVGNAAVTQRKAAVTRARVLQVSTGGPGLSVMKLLALLLWLLLSASPCEGWFDKTLLWQLFGSVIS